MKKNYFVLAALTAGDTKCIANLGVVPLFLFPVFLFAPAFLAFLSLLFVVTHVLETMIKPLYRPDFTKVIESQLKLYFVSGFNRCVKIFFNFMVLFLILQPNCSEAKDLVLSRGQSQSISLKDISKFNIGNKEVISYKFDEKNKTMTIRGTKIGTSELLVWNKGHKEPEQFQIFVVSKAQESKYLMLAQSLSHLGVSVIIEIPHVLVSGEIKTLKNYLQYKKIQSSYESVILDEVELSMELKKEILADVYLLLLNEYKDSAKCRISNSDVVCLVPTNDSPSESVKKHLKDRYRVSFIEQNIQQVKNNYSFKLKLVQLEQLDGEELRLGLESLNTTIGELIALPLNKIIEKNAFLLSQKKVKINTLAEPIFMIRPQNSAEFQIGADVPFITSSKDGNISHTEWKFAGLKIQISIENVDDKIKVSYESELTKPSGESNGAITGSKEKTSVIVSLDQAIKIFQISLKTDAVGNDQMPFLNKIPILGEIFKSKSSQSNFKMITGIIEIKNYE